ncbi:hypothetical protein DFQ01_109164 [Paenibacillus cellulosilyticus]|uniref:Lipoprotein n=1 Tax=Paenibacillus cellulosilyticus TaxID=375489 RepID=A0A2V2YTF9_9BACL|nr:hypothetical protein [Paenibacillus cellulosilyticus]PWW02539.1 hypothetical protein DFQ01_109164 [Paenibacillus cellulosilyticus]QKS47236.1 hypothetical protein HUB94_22620 [Paenibacillus cellulosilyticus]
MNRYVRLNVALLTISTALLGCDQSKPVAAPSTEASIDLSDLQNEISALKQQLKEKDDQIRQLQDATSQTNSVVDQLAKLQEKENSLFHAVKSISKQNFPILLDYGDPVRQQILNSIDYADLDLSDNELLLYASVGTEGEELDLSEPIKVYFFDYIHDESTEVVSFTKEWSLTLEQQDGNWVITNIAKGN